MAILPNPSPLERLRRLAVRSGIGAAGHLPPSVLRAVNIARGIDTPRVVDHPAGTRPVVVAPHPDDELIGVGGTIVHHLAAGHAVHVVHVTSGERTTGLTHLPAAERAAAREAEARAAAARIGVDDAHVHLLRCADGQVGHEATHLERLSATLATIAPDLVYAPWPVDAHRDHTATTRMLADALPHLPSVEWIALYEVWSPLAPTHIVDISDSIDAKLDAVGCYASALTSVDYVHTARGLAAYRSAQGLRGRGHGEAFTVVDGDGLRDMLGRLAL
ncbi:MAG: PIG-L family deacetylase [Acidimicrobiia bacterium]|nr:PIG-L family deacetylase [Acidimicrobiia bacterium]